VVSQKEKQTMPITLTILILVLVAIATLLIAQTTDKVIYQGPASLIANNFKHYSATHRTLSVVLHQSLLGIDKPVNILVATVTKAEAEVIAAESLATRQITVRMRLFGQPRVTAISK